jgi:hypothetical protein
MPNIDKTLALYFPNLLTLNVSHNLIVSLEAHHLSSACPLLENFIFKDNRVASVKEILPLGKLKKLKLLEFKDNPVVATKEMAKNVKERI